MAFPDEVPVGGLAEFGSDCGSDNAGQGAAADADGPRERDPLSDDDVLAELGAAVGLGYADADGSRDNLSVHDDSDLSVHLDDTVRPSVIIFPKQISR